MSSVVKQQTFLPMKLNDFTVFITISLSVYGRFWDTKSVFSPEERLRAHNKIEEQKGRDRKKE